MTGMKLRIALFSAAIAASAGGCDGDPEAHAEDAEPAEPAEGEGGAGQGREGEGEAVGDGRLRAAPTLASGGGFRLRAAEVVGASDVVVGPDGGAARVRVAPVPAGGTMAGDRFRLTTLQVEGW